MFRLRFSHGYALGLLFILLSQVPLVLAHPDTLVLRDGASDKIFEVAELRDRADVEFRFYDPYLAEDVVIRGLVFRDFLQEHFGAVPSQLHFEAWDHYAVTLSGWDDPNWILVTHHNNEPLALRQRGPLRLIERDYGNRDPARLRNFNDWVWMIRSIEAVW